MPEIPSEEELAAAVERAKDLPRISKDDIKPEEIKGPSPFGNNFYILFLEIQHVRENPDNISATTYLREAEKLGKPWQDFLSQNTELLAEIDTALDQWKIYDEIMEVAINLAIATRDRAKLDDFNKRFNEDLGINAIAIPIYRRLNPLLQQAADAMRNLGIDPIALAG
ncbi:hypothetical protein HZC21_05480 [Candidatus Peregrinibacteria bacterium]|nr:hypothetical protein [Candidatus Peregrinibacteria bacterium]